MAAQLRIRTKGTKGVMAKLSSLDAGLRGEVLETAVRVGSQIVEGEARRKAPRQSGDLARSIRSRTVEAGSERALAVVEAGEFYGRFVEFGTRKMAARPFLRPAVRENRVRVLQAVRGVIGRILNARYGI